VAAARALRRATGRAGSGAPLRRPRVSLQALQLHDPRVERRHLGRGAMEHAWAPINGADESERVSDAMPRARSLPPPSALAAWRGSRRREASTSGLEMNVRMLSAASFAVTSGYVVDQEHLASSEAGSESVDRTCCRTSSNRQTRTGLERSRAYRSDAVADCCNATNARAWATNALISNRPRVC
jgi:hypothetical protein